MRTRYSLTALRSFEATARTESFTLAARELGVTRPAISKQVRLLEEEIGLTLINRYGNQFQLTDEGAQLFQNLGQAFDQISSTIDKLKKDSLSANSIKILADRDFASSWLASVIGKFLIQHPGIAVEITAEKNNHFHMEKNFNYRIFYGTHGSAQKPSLEELHLCHWIDLPLCTKEYAEQNIKNSQFAKDTLFLLDKNYNPWPDWFEATDCPSINIEKNSTLFNETTLCLSAASTGSGITIGDSLLALPYIQLGSLIMPFPYGLKSKETYSLFKDQNGTVSKAEKQFENWLFREMNNYQNAIESILIEKNIHIIER